MYTGTRSCRTALWRDSAASPGVERQCELDIRGPYNLNWGGGTRPQGALLRTSFPIIIDSPLLLSDTSLVIFHTRVTRRPTHQPPCLLLSPQLGPQARSPAE